MAKKPRAEQVVDAMIDDIPIEPEDAPAEYQPAYQMIGDTRIPVSKSTGKLWESRREQSKAYLDNLGVVQAWEEVIAYYKNDHAQSSDKENDPTRETSGSHKRFSRKYSQTENIVFANVSALVPATYAKNPRVEITAFEKKDLEPFVSVAEKLINVLIRTKVAPGVNLKPKMRRGVIMATLTNHCFFETGYIKKEDSSDAALQDLEKAADDLKEAKSIKDIEEVEGRLKALETKVAMLSPSGPYVKFKDMRDVFANPNTVQGDFMDTDYFLVRDQIPTEQLRAMYGKKNENGEWMSIFQPTAVLKVGQRAGQEADLATSNIFNQGTSFRDYGYKDEESFRYAQMTTVWYCWDMATRRVMLFNDKDWTWPLWVWDDPYELDTFFNLTPMSFYADPEIAYARSEVMYYLNQQDEINKINSEVRRARDFLTGKFIYNSTVLKDSDVAKMLEGTSDKRATGMALPPDTDMSKLVASIELPALRFPEMFNKGTLYEAIDRLSSVGVVMRNQEFKTNTTNKAIENYESGNQTRLDEKIDAVEDVIGDIGWKLLQLCIRNMSSEEVGKLIGEEAIPVWDQFALVENIPFLQLQVVGGSGLKPTSKAKKEEAVQMGQALGQFANASPAVVLVMLKMMERAFDDFTIGSDDWNMIIQSIEAQMNKGRTDGSGGGVEGGGAGGGGVSGGNVSVDQIVEELDKIMDQLPDPVVKAFGNAIAAGGKPSEVIKEIIGTMNKSADQQQGAE